MSSVTLREATGAYRGYRSPLPRNDVRSCITVIGRSHGGRDPVTCGCNRVDGRGSPSPVLTAPEVSACALRWCSPAREPRHPAWARRGRTIRRGSSLEQAEAALGEPLRSLRARRARRATRAHARRAARGVVHVARRVGSRCGRSLDDVVAFAGHSLGQVTALVASGALDLDDGVRFAARRAELTQRAADEHPGRMAALLGATVEQASRSVRGRTRRVLDRERQRARPGRDRRHARRPRRRDRAGEGARRAARDARSTSAARSTRR